MNKALSEQQQIREPLRESDDVSRLILQSMGEGVVGVDVDGKVTFVNPAASQMLGFDSQELIGHDLHEKIHHSQAPGSAYPKGEYPIHLARAGGTEHHVADDVLWRKDGSSFPVEYSATPIKDGGNLVGAVMVFRDTSGRRVAAEATPRTHQQLQAFFEVLGVGAVLFGKDGTILRANKISENILGVSADEHVQRG